MKITRAVEHQLSESRKKGKPFPNYDYAQLRKLVVEHLKAKRKYFEAFVYNISDDLDGEKDLYEEYCKKIAKDGEWGGELELQALSEILSCRIVVYKQKTQPVVYGDSESPYALYIVFHRYAYSLGGHYNSTV